MVNLTKRTGDHNDLGVLNPGEIWVYTGNYTVTQEDIDRAKVGNGTIENTATVSCNQLSNESSSLVLPIIYIPPNVLIPESKNSTGLPVVNFSTNVTSGYAPLFVQFTDLSQNAISNSWDFNNDGSIDSTDTNPVYTYTTSGTYTANLTASNANGSSSKLATITVLQKTNNSNSGENSGSSSGESNGDSIGKATVVSSTTTTTTSVSPNATQTETTTSNVVQNSTPAKTESTPIQTATETPAKEGKKTPGFELLCGITGLLAVFLYRRR
jgi:PKD repeat protein